MLEDHQRTASFAKDAEGEALLRHLNGLLAPAQRVLEDNREAPRLPVVFIIGAMRSGTTLVSQILAQDGGFGYVSNLTARFWKAPGVGALIDRAVRPAESFRSDFQSAHGVTAGLFEPHEFGYFWDSFFDFGQDTHTLTAELLDRVDRVGLLRAVASLEAVAGKPMVFKNNSWCTLQAAFLARLFPRSLFIVCRRHPLYLAQSVLIGRRRRYGSITAWWSIRPAAYHAMIGLPPHEQVVAQVLGIGTEMDAQLAAIPADRIIEAPYERVCADPATLIETVRAACAVQGVPLPEPAGCPPPTFESTDRQQLPDEDWLALVAALRKHRPDLMPGLTDANPSYFPVAHFPVD